MKHRCVGCKKMFKEKEIIFDVDPYDEDVRGGTKKVWECKNCRQDSAGDI